MKEKLHAESTVSIKLIFSPKVGGGGLAVVAGGRRLLLGYFSISSSCGERLL